MDGTNLNTGAGSGQRSDQSYTGQLPDLPPPPLGPDGKPLVPTGKGFATGHTLAPNENAPTTETNAIVEADVWTDVVVETPVVDIQTTTEQPPAPYVTYSDKPKLQQSTVNDPDLANKTINLVQNPPPQVQEKLFSDYVTNLFADPAPPTPGTENIVVTDPQIIALAQKKGVAPETIQKNVLFEQNDRFNTIVATLPEDVASKLTFAHYVPDGAKNLSPELKAQLALIQKQVSDEVKTQFGFTEDWPGLPVDVSDFVQNLTNQVDYSFEKLLDAKVADGSLSAADAQTLKSMHYGLATGTPTLKNLLITLQNQSIATLQTKFGMDAGFQPKPDVAFYNNVVNGDFAQTFKKNVDKYVASKATPEQQALLKKYDAQIQANPNDPAIPESIRDLAKLQQQLLGAFPDADKAKLPDDLKSVAKGLIATTTTAIIGKYGLDSTWQPTITTLVSATADVAYINKTQAGLDVATDLVDQATTMANQLPDGPEKEQFLAFLQVISKALSALQDSLYAMQAGQSNASRNANRGKLDLALNDLEQQRKAAEKSEANVKKMVSMGPAGKAFMWIVKIVLLLISVWFGPAAMMLALALVLDQVVSEAMGEKKTGLEKCMAAMSENMPPAASAAFKLLMVSMIACVSPWLALYLFSSEAKIVEDIMESTGADESTKAIAAMIINMVVMLIVMLPFIVATGGASSGALAEIIGAQVTASTMKLVQVLVFILSQLPTMLSVAAEGVKMNNNILLAINDIIKGESEAMSEKIQGIIKLMKELIAKLMDIMAGTSANIVSINQFQGSKWTEAGQISSEIAG